MDDYTRGLIDAYKNIIALLKDTIANLREDDALNEKNNRFDAGYLGGLECGIDNTQDELDKLIEVKT